MKLGHETLWLMELDGTARGKSLLNVFPINLQWCLLLLLLLLFGLLGIACLLVTAIGKGWVHVKLGAINKLAEVEVLLVDDWKGLDDFLEVGE